MVVVNRLMDLPLLVFKWIYKITPSNRLSEVDKNLYHLSAIITKSICLRPPSLLDKAYPDTILIQLVERYPNLRKLAIGKKYKEFGTYETTHLGAFIVYLTTQSRHPLSHVKSLIIHEVEGNEADESKKLNRLLMESLSHPKLKSLTIQLLYQNSVLSGLEIQPILEKSIHLKNFRLNCFPDNHASIELTFKNQTSLTSAYFHEFCGPISTLESVKSCAKLSSLRIIKAHDSNYLNYQKIHHLKNRDQLSCPSEFEKSSIF